LPFAPAEPPAMAPAASEPAASEPAASEPAPVAMRPLPSASRTDAAPESAVASSGVDSLAPQEVPHDPPLPIVSPAALEEDDLAVLPGRRRAKGDGRRKYAFVALGVLCFAAAIAVGVGRGGGAEALSHASAAS